MKILIIIHSFTPGGGEKQAIIDANSLINYGHEVTLAFHREGALHRLLSNKVKLYHIRFQNVFFAALQLFFHFLYNRYAVIHSHMIWEETISALPALLTGHKIIFNEQGLEKWRKWHHIFTMNIISRCASKIITPCEATKKLRILREKINEKKLITIYNSYNNHCEINHPSAVPHGWKDEDAYVIGFVGRLTRVKKIHTFIHIADHLKKSFSNLKIIMVGDGDEKESFVQQIIENNLDQYFIVEGFVLNVSSYYPLFDVFVLPSATEALSLSLIEAGAEGIPSIAYDVGGNSEIIIDGITGYLIPAYNVKLLIEKIEYLFFHKEKRLAMGAAAKKHILTNFSATKRINELMNLYKEIC